MEGLVASNKLEIKRYGAPQRRSYYRLGSEFNNLSQLEVAEKCARMTFDKFSKVAHTNDIVPSVINILRQLVHRSYAA